MDSTIALIVFIVLSLAGVIVPTLYLVTKGLLFKRICHDLLGLHIPLDSKGTDRYESSYCKICGKKIKQNSRGDWY